MWVPMNSVMTFRVSLKAEDCLNEKLWASQKAWLVMSRRPNLFYNDVMQMLAIPGNFAKYTKEEYLPNSVPKKGQTCECTQLSHLRQGRIHLHALLYVKCEISVLSTKTAGWNYWTRHKWNVLPLTARHLLIYFQYVTPFFSEVELIHTS